jgi:Tat protein translocase TatB subunit
MFGIGPEELMLIAVLALLVLGPERLPKVMRDMGRIVGDLRKTSDELREEFLNADKLLDASTSKPADPAPAPAPAPESATSASSDESAFDREMREAKERLRGTS